MKEKEINILKNAFSGPSAPVPRLDDVSDTVLSNIRQSRSQNSFPLTTLPLAGIISAIGIFVGSNAWTALTDPFGDLFTQLILVMR